MNQLTLIHAETAKRKAIKRVGENNSEFVEAAYRILLEVASRKREFSSLDVWELYRGPKPKSTRAMGAVFVRARKAGIIRATSRRVVSGRTTDHNQEIRVWESMIA